MTPLLAEAAAGPDWLQYGALGLLAAVLLIGGKRVFDYITAREERDEKREERILAVIERNTTAFAENTATIGALKEGLASAVDASIRDAFERQSRTTDRNFN